MKLFLLILTTLLLTNVWSQESNYLTLETKLHLIDSLKMNHTLLEDGKCHHHYTKRFSTKIYHHEEVEDIEDFITNTKISQQDVMDLTNYYLRKIKTGKIILPNAFELNCTIHIKKIKKKEHYDKIKYDFYLIITH